MDIPEMRRNLSPEKTLIQRSDPHQIKNIVLQVLRKENPDIVVEGGDGPVQIVVEVV